MRPTVFDYTDIPAYLQAMLSWHKAVDPHFSIRREAHLEHRCSPALVTRVLQGQRKLTLERIGSFSRIFRLSSEELTVNVCGRSVIKRRIERKSPAAASRPA